MFERLCEIKKKYDELQERMQQPEVYFDAALYKKYEKEYRELTPVMEAYNEYVSVCDEMDSAEILFSDPELKSLAVDEYNKAAETKSELTDKINMLLLPKDPNDEKNVIVEIRSGVGGEESALFVSDIFRMYSMYAETKGWKIEVASINETELGGIKEIVFIIDGIGAYSKLKFEAGGHRVQRVPVTEAGGRIHTSAITVAILPEIDDIDFKLNMDDVKIDVFRSSGAGGQKVNKTSSAIRVTHIPTGLVVECQDERSQYKNKDRALQILRSKLYEDEVAKHNAAVAAERKSQVGTGDRSDRIRTYNFPQNRVTDHRLEGDNRNFNLDSIINGNLDDLINALITLDRTRKMQEPLVL